MDHVSTVRPLPPLFLLAVFWVLATNASMCCQLCALSTVGIATTGFALGRVERTPKPGIFRRNTLPPQDQPLLFPAHPPKSPSTDVRPQTSRVVGPSAVGADWTRRGKEEECSAQNKSSDSQRVQLRRRGQTLTTLPLRIAEDERDEPASRTRRPSTGWLRRLSMVSFQTETPSTNSPVTPSFNGSASPILPRPPSQRRAPNKLVKRSSSQLSNVHPLLVNTTPSGFTPSTLRRPATSYQRSESIRFQSPLTPDFESRFSENFSCETPALEDFEQSQKDGWKSYWLPKPDGFPEKWARRLSTSGNPRIQTVRRIVPDNDAVPALVLATAITAKTHATQGDQPASDQPPVEFRNPFQAASPTPPTDQAAEKPGHKHACSLNDADLKRIVVHNHSCSLDDADPRKIIVTNTVTASGTPIPERPSGGSLKQVKGQTFSIPRSDLSKSERTAPSSPKSLQRRNITDPGVFGRSQTALRSELPLTVGTANRGLRAPSRSVSHGYKTEVDSLRGPRPLTSDAIALSAWQQAVSSLRHRPKRHSVAASDPSSTVIGSDDTRVFTSSDEYETDLVTDYWDSIRTRETNGSGPKELRIETMFDKGASARLSNEEVATLEDLLPRGSFDSPFEKDPHLFHANSLLASPPLTQLQPMNGCGPVLSDVPDDESARSMVGTLPGEPDGPDHHSASVDGPLHSSAEMPDTNLKLNIFDWSEQSRPDREQSDSETRPRTVHGKQDGANRGSRALGRKAQSTVHLRSQSVPVARDIPTNESRQSSGKFGTWGLGSKGVSEDWDGDFDFDDTEVTSTIQNTKTSDTVPCQSMTVPQAILERQASLRGQYGHVQELTLLVEELKRLRHQASVLDLVSGPSSELWKEAEGIVNLATIDDEDDRRSPPRSPSSLTFSFDDSDEDAPNTNNAPSKRNSEGSWQGTSEEAHPPSSAALGRLSKDSPKSKSVVDILQPSCGPESSTFPNLDPASRAQKLPFDTQSLRDLVVRAGVVTRALKEVIRKAEGVATSPPDVFPSDPPFRRIFDQPSHDDLASFETALAEMH